jgi:3-methyladenine DNA glycosylase/8-oxoguanine DNA glycosylase
MNGAVDIEAYLSKKDPRLGRLIVLVRAHTGKPMRPPTSTETTFQALVRAVIYQRVSESAGATVYSRLEEIAGGKLTPKRIARLTTGQVRKAGLALSKTTYIQNLATWFEENPKVAQRLASMPDEEIVDALTAIRGIGLWTVNVLLVFNLGRMDVAPAPDLIIRRIAQVIYGLKTIPTADFVKQKMECWKPYRSIASMYLWQATKMKVTQADLRRRRHTRIDEAALRRA